MLRLEKVETIKGAFRLTADLTIEAGRKVAVIGPSGAGKSTLIECIAGFLPLQSGQIFWQDQNLTGVNPGQRPMAILFQDGNLFPHLSVADNVGLGVRADLRPDAQQRGVVRDAIARVGLEGLEARKPAALSGGQQSRAALARVLVQARPVLLLDEPFAALGPALKAEMLDLVAELADETNACLIMVSHDPADARRIADQVVIVAEGRAYGPQPTAALLDNPPDVLRAYLGSESGL